MITQSQLATLTSPALAAKYYRAIVDQLAKGSINNKARICAFIAQILHESGGLAFTKENLNYTTEGLMKTWPSKFPNTHIAQQYEKNPGKIANFVYGSGKLGVELGNDQPGDGFKYIGRGLIGVTGKANYTALSKRTGIDFVAHPELLEQPDYALLSAVDFWNKWNLSLLADQGNFHAITQRINGGQIGAEDREKIYNKLLHIYA